MNNFFTILNSLYDAFHKEYLEGIEVKCKECNLCCSKSFWYPEVFQIEYDFLENFIKENNIEISVDKFKDYVVNKKGDFCPYYNKETCKCIVYSARPLFCRFFGLFEFDGDAPLPPECVFGNTRVYVPENEKYDFIKYFSELIELRYRYDLFKAKGKEEELEALIKLGEEYIRQSRYEESLVIFERAGKINSREGRVHYNLGSIYRSTGDLKKAKGEMEMSLSLGGEKDFPYIYQNLGFICLDSNMAEASKEYFKKAIEVEPEEALSYIGMAFLFWADGEKKKARINCEKAIELDPHNVMAQKLKVCFAE